MASLFGLASYFSLNLPIVFLLLIVLNFLLWLISLVIDYKDGQDIFPFGYLFVFGSFLIYALFFCTFEQSIKEKQLVN
jgi:hypothetical protein